MKTLLTLTFLTLSIISTKAQDNTLKETDSLKRQLSITKQDTGVVQLLIKISERYHPSQPDSAMLYGKQALSLARQINFIRGEVNALLSIAVVQRELGNLPKALDIGFKALQIAEANRYYPETIVCLIRIANVYYALNDYPKALSYYRQAEKQAQAKSDELFLTITKMHIGDAYEQMNQLDSALHYAELAYQKMFQVQGDGLSPNVFRVLGNIQAKLSNSKPALAYYQQGVQAALKNSDYRTASTIYTNIASFYKKSGNPDSAIYYAKQGLSYGQMLSYKSRIMTASNLLAELYEPKDATEALRYYKIANAAKDSLYSIAKVQALQNLSFDEQERQREIEAAQIAYRNKVKQYALIIGLGVILIIALTLYRNNRVKQKANALLQQQKEEIQNQKSQLQQSLDNLKAAQAQLVQSEKMASLGELTAGIAHEIQNPLNFVKNFSEVNTELIDEMQQEMDKGNYHEAKAVAGEIKQNEQKINIHGRRAEAIVNGMLQHSRKHTGEKHPTDINALIDEFMNLSYHGLRAKDKQFNATMQTSFDKDMGKPEIIPQDIGRVILNLFNNAFYSVSEKKKQRGSSAYEPVVSVKTKRANDKVEISIRDNGIGIATKNIDRIFQPFYTTKPMGEGTGLGLSLSYDIIKAHGGELRVVTKEGEYAEFIISLPYSNKTETTLTV